MWSGLGSGLGDKFVFPAPTASYGVHSFKKNLCWIPWNSVISPDREKDPLATVGIPCLWFPAPKAALVILFFHANAEDLGMSFSILKHMQEQFKVNVLAVEYPGYGLLQGLQPSEDGVYEVALTTFRYLIDHVGARYSQLILMGRSLGSGPAVHLAAQYPVGGLILVSAFCSIRAAVQSIVGRVLAWPFRERFPNLRTIANVSCPTLFIHGESDSLIPMEHALRLFKRCRARKLLITPPAMEHNSNLFGDPSFLATPAIHFFGFPGYYTASPPRLPQSLFNEPNKRSRGRCPGSDSSCSKKPWFCDCMGRSGDGAHMDANVCSHKTGMEELPIRFYEDECPEMGEHRQQQQQQQQQQEGEQRQIKGPHWHRVDEMFNDSSEVTRPMSVEPDVSAADGLSSEEGSQLAEDWDALSCRSDSYSSEGSTKHCKGKESFPLQAPHSVSASSFWNQAVEMENAARQANSNDQSVCAPAKIPVSRHKGRWPGQLDCLEGPCLAAITRICSSSFTNRWQ
mmetsp:Transcript_9052/g.17282  ORF Transcript_9052/g.17282 Transcript_9052/m.17282 type:complete len:512 (-) Transcript_9052:39-1574(-)